MIDRIRQAGIVSEDVLQFPIHIVGTGGIGSPTALVLAQMGCRALRLSDPDVVSEENLAYQLFPLHAVGRPKVEALREVLEAFSGCTAVVDQRRVTGDDPLQGVVIVAVDTLDARRDIWRALRGNPAVPLFIDARMGGEGAEILVLRPFQPQDIRFYEELLTHTPAPLPCTARGIAYNVWAVAAVVGSLVKRFALGEKLPLEIRLDLATLNMWTWDRQPGG